MKYIFHIFMFFLFVCESYAQPTLTKILIPQIGEKYSFSYCDTSGLNPGKSGPSLVWDFTTVKRLTGSNSEVNFEIVAPSTGLQGQFFKDATYAFQTDSYYNYFKVNGSQIQRLGTGYDDGHELLLNLQISSIFPFSYLGNYSDDFGGNFVTKIDGKDYTLLRLGTVKCVADGFGTIVLPTGTFNNVLRLKVEQTILDSLPPAKQGAPYIAIRTTTVNYIWLNTYYKFPLFTISTSKIVSNNMGMISTSYSGYSQLYDTKPTWEGSLSQPEAISPSNDTIITLPTNLVWTSSILTSVEKGKNEISSSILYQVEVCTMENFSVSPVYKDEISGTSSFVNALSGGTKFYWRVRSVSGTLFSEWSPTSSFTIKTTKPKPPILSMPSNDAVNFSLTGSFSWLPDSVVKSWKFQISSEAVFSNILVNKTLNTNKYTLSEQEKLEKNRSYFWRIKGFSINDSSEWSSVWDFRTILNAGINDARDEFSLTISPNPVKNRALLQFNTEQATQSQLKLINLNGEILINHSVSELHTEGNSYVLDISNLQPGVYLIIIYENSKQFVRSIIKI